MKESKIIFFLFLIDVTDKCLFKVIRVTMSQVMAVYGEMQCYKGWAGIRVSGYLVNLKATCPPSLSSVVLPGSELRLVANVYGKLSGNH